MLIETDNINFGKLLMLRRNNKDYETLKKKYAGKLFVIDDRYPDEIIELYEKTNNNTDKEMLLHICPFCNSETDTLVSTYYDNNGVVSSAWVCPYCTDIYRRTVDGLENKTKYFKTVKEDILKKRGNK